MDQNFDARIKRLRTEYDRIFRSLCGSEASFESFTALMLWEFCDSDFLDSKGMLINRAPVIGKSPLHRYLQYCMCRAVPLDDAALRLEGFVKSTWNDLCKEVWKFGSELPRDVNNANLDRETIERLKTRYTGTEFQKDLNLMVANYEALFGFSRGHGRGWHLSIPTEFHSILESEFGLECEAFASPINVRSKTFFSLFPTDVCFGSLGNFFQAAADTKTFVSLFSSNLCLEVNPPFEPLILEKTFHVLERLMLEAPPTSRCLFAVILPNWEPCLPITLFKSSRFTRDIIPLEKGSHEYKNGWPYNLPLNGPRIAWNDSPSLVLFVASSPMSVSPELRARILDAWRPSTYS